MRTNIIEVTIRTIMNIVVLGPQGSGKGTQAEKLAQKFGLEHIDMGKFLREVAKQDSALGREVYQIQNMTKTLVPSRILQEVFTMKLNSIPQEQGIVFDGFPRNLDQAQYFQKALLEFGRVIDVIFNIKISEEEAVKRISKRWVCEKCKSVFIMGKEIKDKKEKCPACGNEIGQRIDDTPEGVRKRLKVFREETVPVLNSFEENGLVVDIDGEQPIDKVFEDILKKVKEINDTY